MPQHSHLEGNEAGVEGVPKGLPAPGLEKQTLSWGEMPFVHQTLWPHAQPCPSRSLQWSRGLTSDSRLGDVGVALESFYLQGVQDG